MNMFNLTRPVLAINDYVSLERFKRHLDFLVNISQNLSNRGYSKYYIDTVDAEIKWCWNQIHLIKERIEINENSAFIFGLPIVTSPL